MKKNEEEEERRLEPRMTMATQRQFSNALTNGRSLSSDANDDETGAVLSLPTDDWRERFHGELTKATIVLSSMYT